ncbi:MAG: hypothetical protein CL610_02755 [Anaerolineaceae bacterium]|nr:hypothetical protein [Anaerolineaceae bacterium]
MLTFDAAYLTSFAEKLYEAAGAPPDYARIVAESLVKTNLLGHDSHGLIRTKMYIGKAQDGSLQPTAKPELVQRSGATAIVDCHWGFGQVGARYGTEVAADIAREFGMSSVALSQVNHIGRLGEYAQMLAEQGLVGIVMTAGSMFGGSVTPYAAAERVFGTNPMAWAVPVKNGRAPLVLDFATSVVAEGKLQVARSKGASVPEDWIYNAEGKTSIDPHDFYNGGMLRTFGGYKGAGLALMVEIIATLLAGFAPVSTSEFKTGNPTMIMAMAIDRFTTPDRFERLVEELLVRMKSLRRAEGFDELLLPGEPEARSMEQRLKEGIPLPETVWAELTELAAELGVAVP